MMKLTFHQNHCESGSVTGKGIDWSWTGRDAHGDMDAVETIGETVYAAVREEWDSHLSGSVDFSDLPLEADVEWDGETVENVTDVRLLFEFVFDALNDPEATLEEVQCRFATPVVLDSPLEAGENTAKVGDKTITITIEG